MSYPIELSTGEFGGECDVPDAFRVTGNLNAAFAIAEEHRPAPGVVVAVHLCPSILDGGEIEFLDNDGNEVLLDHTDDLWTLDHVELTHIRKGRMTLVYVAKHHATEFRIDIERSMGEA